MSIHPSAFPFRRHALALALALATGASSAATINVSGDCSLINAINNANSDTDTDGSAGCPAGNGADSLNLKPNSSYTLTTVNNTTTQGNNGLPVVSSTITINGNGSTLEALASSVTPFRLFEVAATGNLTIDQAQLIGGGEQDCNSYFSTVNSGGNAIFNSGSITLTNSTISENSATVGGCTIANGDGNITLTNSTISGNNSSYGFSAFAIVSSYSNITLNESIVSKSGGIESYGDTIITLNHSTFSGNAGGISTYPYYPNYGDLTLTLNNSTFSDNRGGFGNAKYRGYLDITLNNSTISGNDIVINSIGHQDKLSVNNSTISNNGGSTQFWGSIYMAYGTMSFNNSTFSGNAGGIHGQLASLSLTHSTFSGNGQGIGIDIRKQGHWQPNTKLANSIIANNTGGDCYITWVTLYGTNLIEDGSCGAPLSGDPKLRALLDNGGPTLTHAIKGGSPAVAAADPTFCQTTDQRNFKRPSSCDLGAFERKTKIPDSVAPLVQLLDDQVASGGISGNTPGQKLDQRIALRNQLLTAGDYQNRNLNTEACAQLTRTLGYIDPDNTPEADDYVTGSGGGLLTDEINVLRSDWSCS